LAKFVSKIYILSTHNIFRWTFADFVGTNAISCLVNFF